MGFCRALPQTSSSPEGRWFSQTTMDKDIGLVGESRVFGFACDERAAHALDSRQKPFIDQAGTYHSEFLYGFCEQ
ncbi:MAG: hypothetical protein ACOYIB_01690 [Desulfosporosinus sp.]